MRVLASFVAVIAALSGCGGKPAPAAPDATAAASSRCAVTAPGGRVPADEGFDFGNGSLAVALWPDGTLVAGRLPDGGSYAEIAADGSIEAKLGWWRGVEGRLSIEGERIDAPAPPLRADIPDGYGARGFQATRVTFPTEGCSQVRGSVGRERLTFVLVRRRA
jgi:hypothetical protein